MKAVWNNTIVAESDKTIIVENNHYFPPDSIKPEYFVPVDKTTVCAWKGIAKYYTLVVDGERNDASAWYYDNPKPEAMMIKDYIGFWKGVQVIQ